MGVIKEADGKARCHMRLVNTGNDSLVIVKVQAGCGCTAIDYPEAPIAPGDTAAVGITYNPSGRPGQFSKQALIFTNTTPRRTVLEITGNVIPTDATLDKQYPVKAGPLRVSQRVLPFGELTRGSNKTLYLSAYNASTDTLVVTVQGARPHVKPALVPDTVPPARVTALTVHYVSGHAPQWGLNVDTLTLSCRPLSHSAATPGGSADVHVLAQVLEDFSSLTDKEREQAPVVQVDCGDRLDFGAVMAGQVVTRTFKVTNKGRQRLAVRRLWAPMGEGISACIDRQEIKRGKQATVTVTVDTSQQTGEVLNVPLTLMTNDPDSPRVTVRLVGIID